MRTLATGLVLLAFSLSGCDGEPAHSLLVDLQTDWVPGAEFSSVHVRVEPAEGGVIEPLPTAVASGAEAERAYRDGARVAEVAELASGNHRVVLELRDTDGRMVATRGIRIEIDGDTGLLVIIARDCRDVVCPSPGAPDLTECVGGSCAAPECSPERRDLCPAPECTTSADCASADACAIGVCSDEGACLFTPDSTRCGAGEYCDPDRGCRALPTMDAGVDAGTDAGTDARMDADAGPSDSSPPIDPALIAWWRLDESDPASGISDSTGHGHGGGCGMAGCPTSVPGRIGGAMSFARSSYLEVPHSPDFVVTSGFTVTAWALLSAPASSSMYYDIVAKPLGSGNANSWQFTYFDTDGDGALELRWLTFDEVPSLWFVDTEDDPFTIGDWHHFAGTYSSAGTLVLFVDGVEVGSRSFAGVDFDTHPVIIGGDLNFESPVNFWPGSIDDVRYYGRVLDDGEIAALASGGS
jgi:hypothetical protein